MVISLFQSTKWKFWIISTPFKPLTLFNYCPPHPRPASKPPPPKRFPVSYLKKKKTKQKTTTTKPNHSRTTSSSWCLTYIYGGNSGSSYHLPPVTKEEFSLLHSKANPFSSALESIHFHLVTNLIVLIILSSMFNSSLQTYTSPLEFKPLSFPYYKHKLTKTNYTWPQLWAELCPHTPHMLKS